MSKIESPGKKIESVKLPDIPEDQLGRSLQSQNNGEVKNRFTNIKSNNFTKNHRDGNMGIGNLHEVEMDEIEDEAENRDIVGEELTISPQKGGAKAKLDSSLKEGVSMSENDVDGLLDWAIGLPDDDNNKSGSSFFKKGIV